MRGVGHVSRRMPGRRIDITGYTTQAARYCVITGGEYKTTGNDTGQEKGTCSFKNGRTCDASDYFVGKCNSMLK